MLSGRAPLAKAAPADLITASAYALAREHFFRFRQLIQPNIIWNWWTREVSDHLEQFYYDMLDGLRPQLALMAPPQHGKTKLVTDFIAWLGGMQPDWRTIYASYSEELCKRANKAVQRSMQTQAFQNTFQTRIGLPGWRCDQSLIEYAGDLGSFRTATIEGQISGMTLNVGIVDDPVKDRQAANSKTTRDSTWDWFTDVYLPRFDQHAGLLVIMTRWHVDDLLGRMLERDSKLKVLRYPAIAERDTHHHVWEPAPTPIEPFREIHKPYVWRQGTPLFPEWKPLDFLLERERCESEAGWSSLYQQHPIIVGGGELPVDKFMPRLDPHNVRESVQAWDKAGTEREPGTAGATAGRPVGARGRFSERFIDDLTAAWNEHGETALAQTAKLYPEHRSRRALLTHRAPALDGDEKPLFGPRM